MHKFAMSWILAAFVAAPALAGAATVTDGTTPAEPGTTQAAASPAPKAMPSGPVCLSLEPFADILVWFFDFHGITPNWIYFDAVGQDLLGNRPQSITLFADAAGTTLHVGYTSHPKPGFDPVIAGGTIDLATRRGPGQCFAPDLGSCGDFTFQVVPCPTSALVAGGKARAQGQRD